MKNTGSPTPPALRFRPGYLAKVAQTAMALIRIYIARHLCTAPRPQKEAEGLAEAGHEVHVHGIAFDTTQSQRDEQIAAARPWRWEPVRDYTNQGFSWWIARLRHHFAKLWFQATGRISADVWSYGNRALWQHAQDHPADLTIVHAEGSLWFGEKLQRSDRQVGVDFEDWFSADLTEAQRVGRPVAELARLEAHYCRTAAYCFTTSRALAKAMAEKFTVPPPQVIHNTFAEEPSLPLPTPVSGPVKLHWFSLVVGPHRGLEELMAALPQVEGDWELSLRGNCEPAYAEILRALLPTPLQQRLQFLPLVPAAELPRTLCQFDVGLALELSDIPSRDLTITNKFFHYLQSGLAIVASDTAGHREGLEHTAGVGELCEPRNATSLAAALNHWTRSPHATTAAKNAARTHFVTTLAHEHQCNRYAAAAQIALSSI